MFRIAALLLALAFALAGPARSGDGWRLVMIEQPGCPWCRAFDREMAPAYTASPEGRLAPLERLPLGQPAPEGMTWTTPPLVTPTFLLIDPGGAERGRMIGYPGRDFFWSYLGRMFAGAGLQP